MKHLTFWEADQLLFFDINGISEAYFGNSCRDLFKKFSKSHQTRHYVDSFQFHSTTEASAGNL